MVTDDVKALLQTLNQSLTRDLESAVGFTVTRSHYEVTLEHLLIRMLDGENSDLICILRHFDVRPGRLEKALVHHIEDFRQGNAGRPAFSPSLLRLIESAYLLGAVHHDLGAVRSGTLLAAMLRNDGLQTNEYMSVLRHVRRGPLREHFFEIVEDSEETGIPAGMHSAPKQNGVPADGEERILDRFTMSFTQRARDGQIDPISGRNEEIRQVTDILSRRRKNNPILVGEAGVGKTAVVEGLARRVVEEEVRAPLADIEIYALDLGALKAGASVQGEFEQRLKSVLREVREAAKRTILFVDEAHTLIGAGGSEGTGDAANLLKPALARGQLRAIAATTWSEYKQHIENDPALERRFQPVLIEEPSVEETAVMLRGIKPAYEEHHRVQITDRAVTAAAELSDQYVSGRQLPDKAVDLLDTTAARVRVSLTARPARLDDLDRRLDDLETRIAALRRDFETGHCTDEGMLDTLTQRRDRLRDERNDLEAQWKAEKEGVEALTEAREKMAATATSRTGGTAPLETQSEAPSREASVSSENAQGAAPDGNAPVGIESLLRELDEVRGEQPLVHGAVNEQIVAEVVSDWTGIPVGDMLEDEAELLLSLEERLRGHILGQDQAIEEVAEAVRTSKADLTTPDAPLGVFLFVGPSGVGKTETALRLADLLFGGERFLTTINMSEYQERHTASQLKGSPPGYVGYGEGGVLTEAVRQRPYSVVLLDEVEKAHRDVINLFYQVFDKGFMRDGEGREIDFRNTVIIMTSNLAAETITRQVRERDDRPDPDQVRDTIHPTLVDHFQPALLGRMRVVPYYPLDTETMKEIARIKLDEVADRLQAAHGVDFAYNEPVVTRIADRCTQVDAGARNVNFIINRSVLPEAAQVLIPRMAQDDVPESLTLGLDEDGAFSYTFD